MFDSIRNNSKILMGLLFLLVIPSFVLFGIEGYSQFEDKGAVVARLDGQKITQSEWDAVHQQEVDRIRASVPNLDPKLLDSAEARYATLEKMVNDRLIARASESNCWSRVTSAWPATCSKTPRLQACVAQTVSWTWNATVSWRPAKA